MSEKFPLKNIVGGTPEQKRGARDELNERFNTQSSALEKWGDVEVEKSPEIIRCIEVANKSVQTVLDKYGVEVDIIPLDKIHQIKGSAWPERLKDTGAFFSLVDQCVVIPDNRRSIQLTTFLAHEFLHFHGYQAVQFTQDGLATNYRAGFTVESRDGQTTFFEELNEAITETLTRECFYTDDFQAAFAEELRQTAQVIADHPNAVDSGNGGPLFNDQVYYATISDEFDDGSYSISTDQFLYQKEREGFELLCEKIYEKNTGQFASLDEVKKTFVQAAFDGSILTIGKTIEKTFGKGVLRELAKHESDNNFLDFVRSL